MATYSPLATVIINLKTNAIATRSSGGSTPTPPEPPEPPEENIKQFTWISAGFEWTLLKA